jgi:4-carboxymuconolactone decarboxylase
MKFWKSGLLAIVLAVHAVSDATFKAVVEKVGEQGAVDLIAVNGYYVLVSMILNVDRAPVPGGGKPLPPLK